MRKFIVPLIITALLSIILLNGCQPKEPEVKADKCGNGICDEFEKEKGVCPEDCLVKDKKGKVACDALNPCDKGECYKFKNEKTPICYEGDPCKKCGTGKCIIAESYPMQVFCQ